MSGTGIVDDVRGIAERFAERDASDPESYPAENIADLQRLGVLLSPFSQDVGGRSAGLPELVQVTESVAAASASTALLLSMPLGVAGLYGLGASAAPSEHRAAWSAQIEQVAGEFRADHIYAACNSEKGTAGSLLNTTTTVDRRTDGELRITGEKILASFGRHADTFFSTARVRPDQLPGAGPVEFFLVRSRAPGVEIRSDWNGFGMRSTESHSVRYDQAPVVDVMGFPGFIDTVQPITYWYCLFAAISLGCAGSMLQSLATPAPESPALRLRFSEALMRYEAMRAYLLQTAAQWKPAAGPGLAAKVLRMKTYVTQEATRLCAELFALSGGRHYTRTDRLARALADSFAGTALRPPLPLALDSLVQDFSLSLSI
ncbi:MAG: acyl-CoA dehydrogenase family protein [Dehalococcoidia bacterium]